MKHYSLVKGEMAVRLKVIIKAAQDMQYDLTIDKLTYIKKQIEEIEQYTQLVRIDVDYLTEIR